MKRLPIDGENKEFVVDVKSFWVNYKGLDIEILCTVCETYTRVSANYFLWNEDEISGEGIHKIGRLGVKASLIRSTKLALKELDQEMDEQGLTIWNSKRPDTNEQVTFEFFGPKKRRIK